MNNQLFRFLLVGLLAWLVVIISQIILQSILNFLSKRKMFETIDCLLRVFSVKYDFIDHSITQILDLPTQKHRLIICTILNDVNLFVNYLIIQCLQFYLTELFIQSLSWTLVLSLQILFDRLIHILILRFVLYLFCDNGCVFGSNLVKVIR